MANVLLIEPSYKNKYPPLGLMKISTYHKLLGDTVYFTKGTHSVLKNWHWDRIYISSLFTFNWNTTVKTIKYYLKSVSRPENIYCGGVMATLMKENILNLFPITLIPGLIDKPGMLGDNSIIVDTLTPDYSIIDNEKNHYLDYDYPFKDTYIAYSTRGCIRHCEFCAVPIIEPCYNNYVDIISQITDIKNKYGEKKNLILLDNNVLASKYFDQIIEDIKELGFEKGAKFSYVKNNRKISALRYVDFNQGVDARLLTEEKCKKLSEIAIKPLRIAFDHADEDSINLYVSKVRLAANCGIKHLSNYMLFNFDDTPQDLYKRLKINIELNEEFRNKGFDTQIFSFPMKFSPVKGEHCFDRKHIGKFWNQKYLRAIQCILNATHGVVGSKKQFFERAFGHDLKEFFTIMSMPEKYILERKKHEISGQTHQWLNDFEQLSPDSNILKIVLNSDLKTLDLSQDFLNYYIS